ncbi:MAG: hypothetical protein ABI671_12145 [Burkholderiales bacterium]
MPRRPFTFCSTINPVAPWSARPRSSLKTSATIGLRTIEIGMTTHTGNLLAPEKVEALLAPRSVL